MLQLTVLLVTPVSDKLKLCIVQLPNPSSFRNRSSEGWNILSEGEKKHLSVAVFWTVTQYLSLKYLQNKKKNPNPQHVKLKLAAWADVGSEMRCVIWMNWPFKCKCNHDGSVLYGRESSFTFITGGVHQSRMAAALRGLRPRTEDPPVRGRTSWEGGEETTGFFFLLFLLQNAFSRRLKPSVHWSPEIIRQKSRSANMLMRLFDQKKYRNQTQETALFISH